MGGYERKGEVKRRERVRREERIEGDRSKTGKSGNNLSQNGNGGNVVKA